MSRYFLPFSIESSLIYSKWVFDVEKFKKCEYPCVNFHTYKISMDFTLGNMVFVLKSASSAKKKSYNWNVGVKCVEDILFWF